ncbi:MAG: sulfite exporter TauE/SafE family protein [Phycisphaerae bacterium]|nr:sulfite exporter TauE/SafE family protein [Phycisphaerae bacterium]
MDPATIGMLCGTAAFIGLIHTLLGPDHYVPFVVMAQAGRWSLARTLAITIVCGAGHVLGSVVLGGAGIALGAAMYRLAWIESIRGDVAGWLLLGFGLAYMAWGVRRAVRNRPHSHVHSHADGTVHAHEHTHHREHAHAHADEAAPSMTPWILFTIFVFGPCEPLIPLLMYPAARHSPLGVAAVTLVFGVVTIATMTAVVWAAYCGLMRLHAARMARYSHAAAGFALAACGLAVTLGL